MCLYAIFGESLDLLAYNQLKVILQLQDFIRYSKIPRLTLRSTVPAKLADFNISRIDENRQVTGSPAAYRTSNGLPIN